MINQQQSAHGLFPWRDSRPPASFDTKVDVVSVIMPTFNSENSVERAIRSLVNQSYQNWELLVCDDASTDNTLNIVRLHQASDHRVRLLPSNINQGPGVARNRGIAAATGRYIAFLDSDDEWVPHKLKRQIEVLNIHPRSPAICSAYHIVTTRPSQDCPLMVPPKRISYEMLRYHNFIGCLTVVYDTQRTNGKVLMPEIRQRQDWGLWIRIAKTRGPFIGLQEPLGRLHRANASMTSNKFRSAHYTTSMLRNELGMGPARAILHTLIHNVIAAVRITRARRRGEKKR